MAMSGGAALAAPDDSEPLMKLLADKGLLAPDAPASPARRPPPMRSPRAAAPTARGLIRRVQDRASDMVVSAMNFIGVRYRRGGTRPRPASIAAASPVHVFEMSLGLVLPRRADEQAAMPGLVKVERNELKPGDLVFFNTMRRTFSHVGIYIGDNRFVHAPSQGKDVRTDDMTFATGPSASPARAAPSCRPAPRPPSSARPNRPRTERRTGRPSADAAPRQGHNPRMAERVIPLADHRYLATAPAIPATLAAPTGLCSTGCSGRCTTSGSRSPTAAISAAATACRRRSSTSSTPSCRIPRC
jgi:hypothetical protein